MDTGTPELSRRPWFSSASERGQTDGLLGIKLLDGCLLGALADPGEQHRGEDPSPFGIVQAPNRRCWRNGAIHLDDPTRGLDGGGSGVSLPLVLERRQRDFANGADLPHDRDHAGGGIAPGDEPAGAEAGAAAAVAAPPPLKGGGCSIGCQSFSSGPTALAK